MAKKKNKGTSTITYSSSSISSSSSPWYYSTSGAIGGFDFEVKPTPLEEDQEINVKLLDGTEVTMTLKDYMQFIAYNKMVPSDCKDIHEFNEKMLVFRI